MRAARYGAMTGESCQPCNLTRVNNFLFYFKVPRDAYFFSTFYVCFIFIFSLLDALGLITFAFNSWEILSPLRQPTRVKTPVLTVAYPHYANKLYLKMWQRPLANIQVMLLDQ